MPSSRSRKKERKKKPSGPMSAAGLISFYEDTDAKITLTPTWILIVSIVFVSIVLALRTALPAP
jgi:preprotein translocase subunit Sec61beta